MTGYMDAIPPFFTFLIRYLMPVLSAIVLIRCFSSLLRSRTVPEVWAYLVSADGTRIPIRHWENAVGRSRGADVNLEFPAVSRSHAVLVRGKEEGEWYISDLDSKFGTFVEGRRIDSGRTPVYAGNRITFADVTYTLEPPSEEELAERVSRPEILYAHPASNFFLLTLIQLLCALQLYMAGAGDGSLVIPLVFVLLASLMWAYYFFIRLMSRTGFEAETIAFFLCTLGLACTASSSPSAVLKQFIAMFLGIVIFIILGFFIRDLDRAKKTRWLMVVAALGLFAANILLGFTSYGSKNWIDLGFITIQPSEFVKIAFVFVGASTLDRLLTKRNLILFIAFTGFCVGALALVGDFGTAAIFFVAFLVIAYMRSGNLATIALIVAAAAFGIVLMISFKPYIAERFKTWGHVWDYANDAGYQQTRNLMYAASGGLFGLGTGNGYLGGVFAADTDLVFGMLCEEWGLIVAVFAVLSIACLAIYTFRSAAGGRSSFYVIAACAAMSIFVFQTMLNVFGSLDILPFTGVTFPFVSNGGSSIMASWGLLAYVKAADTRPNASFAIKKEAGA